MIDYDKIESVSRKVLERCKDIMGDNDRAFFQRVYSKNFPIYPQRLKAIGFDSGSRILDAGCGFGQWTVVMANSFDRVAAVDKAPHRLLVLENILENLGIENVSLKYADLAALPFEDNFFSHIFCYGALFIADWKKTLKEYHRTLQKGGKLYFSANDIGWYIHLWKNRPNATPDYDPRMNAAKAFYNTILYDTGRSIDFGNGSIIMDKHETTSYMKSIGFNDIRLAGEGTIGCPPGANLSFFQSSYEGLSGSYEVLAFK